MPTVQGGRGHQHGQRVQNSEMREEQVRAKVGPGMPRDDLKGAYAGDQNEAKFHREDHPTNLKARKTKKSKDRTPKM